jgi:hypothetical protein
MHVVEVFPQELGDLIATQIIFPNLQPSTPLPTGSNSKFARVFTTDTKKLVMALVSVVLP